MRDLSSYKATALLLRFPTATAFREALATDIAEIKYDGRHGIGPELAAALVDMAGRSVGRHDGPSYRLQAQYACEDISTLRERLKSLDDDIHRSLGQLKLIRSPGRVPKHYAMFNCSLQASNDVGVS